MRQQAPLQEFEQRLRQELALQQASVLSSVKALVLHRAAMAGTAGRRPVRWTAAVAAAAAVAVVAEGSLAPLEQEPRVGVLFAALAGPEKAPEAVLAHAAVAGG